MTARLSAASRGSKCPSEQRFGAYAKASSSSGFAHVTGAPLKVGGGELRSSNIPGVYLRWLEGRGNPIQGATEVRTRIRKSRLLFSSSAKKTVTRQELCYLCSDCERAKHTNVTLRGPHEASAALCQYFTQSPRYSDFDDIHGCSLLNFNFISGRDHTIPSLSPSEPDKLQLTSQCLGL